MPTPRLPRSIESKRANGTLSTRIKPVDILPTVVISKQLVSYRCPLCKRHNTRSLPTVPIEILNDKTEMLFSTLCNNQNCEARQELKYQLLKKSKKKIRLVDFKCKGESYSSKARIGFKVLNSN